MRYTLGMLIICFILSIKAAVLGSSTNKYVYRVVKTGPENLVGFNLFKFNLPANITVFLQQQRI